MVSRRVLRAIAPQGIRATQRIPGCAAAPVQCLWRGPFRDRVTRPNRARACQSGPISGSRDRVKLQFAPTQHALTRSLCGLNHACNVVGVSSQRTHALFRNTSSAYPCHSPRIWSTNVGRIHIHEDAARLLCRLACICGFEYSAAAAGAQRYSHSVNSLQAALDVGRCPRRCWHWTADCPAETVGLPENRSQPASRTLHDRVFDGHTTFLNRPIACRSGQSIVWPSWIRAAIDEQL